MSGVLHTHHESDDEGRLVLTAVGELDAAGASRFDEHRRRMEAVPDLIDLRYVAFIDAAGVTSMLEAGDPHHTEIVASAAVERLLHLCDLAGEVSLTEPRRLPSLSGASFGVAAHDEDLRYSYVNDRLAEINGIPKDEHLAKRPVEIFEPVTDAISPLLRNVFDTQRSQVVQIEGATPAMESFTSTCSYYPATFRLGGLPVNEVVAVVDLDDPPPADPRVRLDLRHRSDGSVIDE